MNIYENALAQAKIPGKITCPECNQELFAPMDKLSINLYGKCTIHLEEFQENNLFKLSESL